MRFRELKEAFSTPYFYTYQLYRVFPEERRASVEMQLSRLVKQGSIIRLKRGLYLFADAEIDELSVAKLIYTPSYVSLETALNIHGLIPDVAVNVTSATTLKTKKFSTPKGVFFYSRIKPQLFFGYEIIADQGAVPYHLATAEKALVDLVYLRRVKDLSEYRVSWSAINAVKLNKILTSFPGWVRDVFSKKTDE